MTLLGPLLGTAPYHEIAPHLVLMAYLNRVVNQSVRSPAELDGVHGGQRRPEAEVHGGSIEREYAIGSGRMDLCLRYGGETLAIEIKVWRAGRPEPLRDGLRQLDGYLAGLGLDDGWLVIFDRRPEAPPLEERLKAEKMATPSGRGVTVIRA